MCMIFIHHKQRNPVYRKERSKRPHQSKRPGALKIAKTRKKRSGALFYFTLLKTAPGRSFSSFFERKAPWVEPTTREGVRKGPAAEAERDDHAAVGGIARVSFFLFIFINRFKLSFLTFVSRPVDSTRPDQQFFSLWKRPGGRLLPYFCCQKRPGGAISELF